MTSKTIRSSGRALVSWIGLMAVICVPSLVAGVASARQDGWHTVRTTVAAYCPCSECCSQYADGVTASGHMIQPGDAFVASDKLYPFGTEMIVPGYNNGQTVKVLDRTGAIKTNQIGVFFRSHQEALEWGAKCLDVQVRN